MSSYRRLRTINDRRFVKWETPGTVIDGLWQGTVARKYTDDEGQPRLNGILKTDEGEVRFSMTGNLTRKLEFVPIGRYVRIEYLGIPTGAREKNFKVEVEDPEAGEPQVDVPKGADKGP